MDLLYHVQHGIFEDSDLLNFHTGFVYMYRVPPGVKGKHAAQYSLAIALLLSVYTGSLLEHRCTLSTYTRMLSGPRSM